MCGQMYESMPAPPGLFARPKDISIWLHDMARWERNRPSNIQARNKRRNFQRIHDYAAVRYLDAKNLISGRFWHGVMVRAKTHENKWPTTNYWEHQVREFE